MKGFLDLPYRLPFAAHYKAFDAGFYVDFPRQLKIMGAWLRESGCRRTLDIGAMTGGCIEYISGLGMRMDGIQFTPDVQRLAAARLREAGVASRLFVSPVHAPPRVPARLRYDGAVALGWFNLPFSTPRLRAWLAALRRLLAPGGVFLFDFFEFRRLVLPPTEAVRLAKDVALVSHAERRGRTLRRYHLWIDGAALRAESSDLVDRSPAEARRELARAGFDVVKTQHLDVHYPREFWLARRR
ncbi:MAG TPA: class I SAM-dependent methyltransferase [Planctomycetota bacterium]